MCCLFITKGVTYCSYNFIISHQKGKEYALKAVSKIEKELEILKGELELLPEASRQEFVPVYNEKMSLLAIANYNLGS